jgi:hypothetical protein
MSEFNSTQPGSGADPTSCLVTTANYFCEVNRLMCKNYRSLLSRTEVENEWSCTSKTTVCLRGTDRPPISLLNTCNSVCSVHCHLSYLIAVIATTGDELWFTHVNHTFSAWGYYLPTLVQWVPGSQLLPSPVLFHLSTALHYVADVQHKPIQTQYENRNMYWSHVPTTIWIIPVL